MVCLVIFFIYVIIKYVGSLKFVLKLRDFLYLGCYEKCKIKLEKVYILYCYYKKLLNRYLFSGFYM